MQPKKTAQAQHIRPTTQGKLYFCRKATQKATHLIAVHGANCGMQSPSVRTCRKTSDNRSSTWAMPLPEAQDTQHGRPASRPFFVC